MKFYLLTATALFFCLWAFPAPSLGSGLPEHVDAASIMQQAENGNPEAQTMLALLYGSGREVLPNTVKRLYWLNKAEEQNFPEAIRILGDLYTNGLSVPQDREKAFAYYSKAAALGDQPAVVSLANAYLFGYGTKKDSQKAIILVREGADRGNLFALVTLGRFYRGEGPADLPKDLKKAFETFEKAAEKGFSEGQLFLGMAYIRGEGCPQNQDKGIEWILKAAQNGSSKAQNFLGGWFALDSGPKDLEQAAYWHTRAAKQGYADSQFELAMMFLDGRGVPEDFQKMFFWLKLAAENGSKKAQKSMVDYYKIVKPDEKKVIYWQKQLAQ